MNNEDLVANAAPNAREAEKASNVAALDANPDGVHYYDDDDGNDDAEGGEEQDKESSFTEHGDKKVQNLQEDLSLEKAKNQEVRDDEGPEDRQQDLKDEGQPSKEAHAIIQELDQDVEYVHLQGNEHYVEGNFGDKQTLKESAGSNDVDQSHDVGNEGDIGVTDETAGDADSDSVNGRASVDQDQNRETIVAHEGDSGDNDQAGESETGDIGFISEKDHHSMQEVDCTGDLEENRQPFNNDDDAHGQFPLQHDDQIATTTSSAQDDKENIVDQVQSFSAGQGVDEDQRDAAYEQSSGQQVHTNDPKDVATSKEALSSSSNHDASNNANLDLLDLQLASFAYNNQTNPEGFNLTNEGFIQPPADSQRDPSEALKEETPDSEGVSFTVVFLIVFAALLALVILVHLVRRHRRSRRNSVMYPV